MSEKKDRGLTESEMNELVDIFGLLPGSMREYVRKNSRNKIYVYLQGFHDGGVFILENLRPRMKKLTEKP